MTALATFLSAEIEKPFRWGVSDCSLFVADWWLHVHGVDPAPWLRGTYATRKECLRLVRRHGSLTNLMFSIANGAGAHTGYEPTEGNFGVVRIGRRPVGFVRTQRYLVAKTETGLAFLGGDAPVLAEWAI